MESPLFHQAPQIIDFINEKSLSNFLQLKHLLQNLGVIYKHNPFLVRGLDYYNDIVFEIKALSSSLSFAGGGAYDGLFKVLDYLLADLILLFFFKSY